MIRFDKTTYTMGSAVKYDNNAVGSAHVKPFCIDKYEYPNILGNAVEVEKTWMEAEQKVGEEMNAELVEAQAKRRKENPSVWDELELGRRLGK